MAAPGIFSALWRTEVLGRLRQGRFGFLCTLRSPAPPDVYAAVLFPPVLHISAAIFTPLFRIPTLFQGSVLRKLE